MILSKIKEIYQKNKKNIFYFLLFVISFFCMWDNSFAGGGDATPAPAGKKWDSSMANMFVNDSTI